MHSSIMRTQITYNEWTYFSAGLHRHTGYRFRLNVEQIKRNRHP